MKNLVINEKKSVTNLPTELGKPLLSSAAYLSTVSGTIADNYIKYFSKAITGLAPMLHQLKLFLWGFFALKVLFVF